MSKQQLNIKSLIKEAKAFSAAESKWDEPSIYGATDGKRVGTYLEQKFTEYLSNKYTFKRGNAASGIDFPELGVDIKVTSVKQPQSSCPYKSARQKIFGLGYNLLVFVYEKKDNTRKRTGRLDLKHTVYVHKERTGDYQITKEVLRILKNEGNTNDLVALMQDKNLPVDEIGAEAIAEEILKAPPNQGYLTISNALQWRLQYQRVIEKAGKVKGIIQVR